MYARLALFLILGICILGCPGGSQPPAQSPVGPAKVGPPSSVKLSKTGTGFRLSNADDVAEPVAAALVPSVALSAADTRKVLDRLPKLAALPDDEKEFALRPRSLPPPRTGKTVAEPFPPPSASAAVPAVASGPLRVLRHAPNGAVDLAPQFSVTFSAPMVPVTSQGELAEKAPSVVRLTPQPPGTWRWIGTQTLLFEPASRAASAARAEIVSPAVPPTAGAFPMATDYQVEVPAGTRAQNGSTLATAERWTFSTPAPKVVSSFPSGKTTTKLDPVIFIAFDQAIDPQAMLKSIEIAGNTRPVTLRIATTEEIDSVEGLSARVEQSMPGRFIAFRPTEKLSPDTALTVKVRAGAPSLEGPKKTAQEQSFTFRTRGRLRITEHRCGWEKVCRPGMPFTVTLSNPLDVESFDPALVRVEPTIPQMNAAAHGNTIHISGRTRGNTKYKVTLASALRDEFEQTLGRDESLSFATVSAAPRLFGADDPMKVLEPQAGGKFPVYSVNHTALAVRLYRVRPEDWTKYMGWRQTTANDPKSMAEPPGELVMKRSVTPAKNPDDLTETPIDLSPALRAGLGHVIVIVESTPPPRPNEWRPRVLTWVQVTNIGMTNFVDPQEAVTFTTVLGTGAPLGGVDVSLLPAGGPVKTSAEGIARLALGPKSTAIVARKGNDVAFLAPGWEGTRLGGDVPKDEVRWFVFDDRRTYKPGEEVRIKGWLRRAGAGKGGDLGLVSGAKEVRWSVRDAVGNEFKKDSSPVDGAGALDFAFKIPEGTNLGFAHVSLRLEGATGLGQVEAHHQFSIQEFRRPEFEVTTQTSEGPHFVGGHAVATVSAAYFAGGGLPNAPVKWAVAKADAVFTPPNRGDYVFGRALDWPMEGGARDHGAKIRPPKNTGGNEFWSARTDHAGKHRLRIDFDALDPSYPIELTVEANVTDVNRQNFASRQQVLVHPGEAYVGIRRPGAFVRAGQAIDVATLTTDIDGRALRGRKVTVSSARLDWEQKGGKTSPIDRDVRTCEITSADQAVNCSLATTAGGRHRVTAIVTDEKGRRNQSEMFVWVVGDAPVDRNLPEDSLTLIPDKEEYQPGDVAEILVVAPFGPGEAVVSVGRQGIVSTQRVSLRGSSGTIKVPIDRSWVPNVFAHVQLTGMAPRKNDAGEVDSALPKRPAYAHHSILLKIAPRERKLTIDVKPRESKIEPGGSTVVDLDVRDANGRPAGASQLTVVVVDEAILALSDYKLPDPIATFYATRSEGVEGWSSLGFVLLGGAPREDTSMTAGQIADDRVASRQGAGRELSARMPAPPPPMQAPPSAKMQQQASGPGGGGAGNAIAVRRDFMPLAAFFPSVTTDASGRARVSVKLPDSLTRYRVMAIAAEGATRFGSGESTITARLPLMVRPSAPRFLNFGDRFDLPVVVQNQTDQPMTVDVAARASNAEIAGTGKRVTVPANDRVEVRLVAAAARAGTARFQIGAASGRWADASQIELPVWTPATTEAFATYGQIDEGAIAQPVKLPAGVVPQFGGLEISTSSTQLQALTDAVLYLAKYPFDCNEGFASRIVAIASLKDVLAAFQTKDLPPPAALVETVQRDLERLRKFQHGNGGFSLWAGGGSSWPYLSIHAAHAMARAKDKGFAVDKAMLGKSHAYLRAIEQHVPQTYPADAKRALTAYALFVRHLLGDSDRARARRLVAEVGGADKLPLEVDGWLLRVLTGDAASQSEVAAIRKHLANRVTETAGAAHFATEYEDGAHLLLSSERRADAVILESLIVDQPKSDLIAKTVAGLLAHRTAGRWQSTQENAFVLVALDRYFRTYEGATPDFVARTWLGDRVASEHAFRGRSTDRVNVDIPMRVLASNPSASGVTLAKDGPGRLYFRIGMTYAPADLKPPAMDRGFTVARAYEAVDRPEDVRRDADGTIRVKAGARVRVRLAMVAPSRRYHVALVDPLPAGFEPLNTALANTESMPQDPHAPPIPGPIPLSGPGLARGPSWFFPRTWVEHENVRDNRVEAFASLVWEGVHPYTYVARATTPGTFVVPPPKAEEMYSPETFGRGPGDRLIVE